MERSKSVHTTDVAIGMRTTERTDIVDGEVGLDTAGNTPKENTAMNK